MTKKRLWLRAGYSWEIKISENVDKWVIRSKNGIQNAMYKFAAITLVESDKGKVMLNVELVTPDGWPYLRRGFLKPKDAFDDAISFLVKKKEETGVDLMRKMVNEYLEEETQCFVSEKKQ